MRLNDGEALLPVEPPADGVLRVRGGVGGVSFQFEELLAGANALDGVVRELEVIVTEAQSIQQALFPTQVGSYGSGSQAVAAVGDGAYAVGQVRDALRETAGQVRASHREYEYTEAMNAIALRVGLLPSPLMEANMLLAAGGPGTHLGDRDRAEHLVAQLPLIVGSLLGGAIPLGVLGPVIALLAGQPNIRAILRGIVELPGLTHLKPRPVTAQKMETTTEDVDTSLASLLRRTEGLHSGGQGEIAVIEVAQPDGSSSWVVLVPGTQVGNPAGGSNPIDEGGIVDALGYDSAHLTPAIMDALRQAGAEAGEKVVAVGHSQGGAHVMNLAANKAFLAEFDLEYVLTAGSPVGGIKAKEGITSLHLEHSQDLVPGYDGLPNADTRNRVTVTLDNPVRTPEGENAGLGPGHRLESYAEGAELVSASKDPSLLVSTAVLSGAIGAGGAAKVTKFKLAREPMPLPTPRQRQPSSAPGTRSAAGPR